MELSGKYTWFWTKHMPLSLPHRLLFLFSRRCSRRSPWALSPPTASYLVSPSLIEVDSRARVVSATGSGHPSNSNSMTRQQYPQSCIYVLIIQWVRWLLIITSVSCSDWRRAEVRWNYRLSVVYQPHALIIPAEPERNQEVVFMGCIVLSELFIQHCSVLYRC